jgi:RecB family exonuclease
MDALIAAAPAHDDAAHPPDRAQGAYAALFAGLTAERDARTDAARPHDRIAILGPLEARATRADLTILGGLNEGLWPGLPDPDPWMTRDMRRTLGLAPPEARIGLSAHDFLLAANAPRAVLSRSRKSAGAPTVASRWLIRLANLLTGVDESAIKAMRARGDAVIARAQALDAVAPVVAAPRPAPCPPVADRPRELPVTALETLIRDPYAVYARYVLKLRALEPIGRAPDARDMGNALHAAMEAFAVAAHGIGPDIAALRAALLSATRATLDEKVPSAALRRLWMKRMERAADWFAAAEAARRTHAPRIMAEARGERFLTAPAGPFKLTARADRIDLRGDGTIAVYDYKTGAPPTPGQQKAFAKQLTLSGDIARAGGFPDIPAGQIAEIAYLGLTGAGIGGKTQTVISDPATLEDAWADLITLISAYDAPTQGYAARMRPKYLKYSGDYDHLSRFGEWGDGGGEDAE